jgi:hypothetical protein
MKTKAELLNDYKLVYEYFNGEPITTCMSEGKYINYFSHCWNELMSVIEKIGNDTGYELVMSWETSYWNQFGENPLNKEFGGYEKQENIYQAVIEIIKWHNENKS